MKVEVKGTCSPAGIKNHKKHKSCMAFSELVTIGAVYNSFVDKAKKEEKKQIKQKTLYPSSRSQSRSSRLQPDS